MPRRVQGPDGVTHEFPDDATDAEISAALDSQQQPSAAAAATPAPAGRTWTDTLTDWLPAVGGTVGGIVGTAAGPMGTLGGAGLGAAAGEAYKELINRARGAAAPATPTAAAAQIATSGVTQGVAPELVGMGVGRAMSAVAPRIMQSAVKPGIRNLVRDVKAGASTPKVVQTLLDEGVNVTPGGLAKLQGLFDATNAEIKAAVASAPGTIDKRAVAAQTLNTAQQFSKQVNPTNDLKAIGAVTQEFLDHPIYTGKTLTPAEAQASKIATYQSLKDKYGKVGAASIEAEKALARGLKEEIAAKVPGISALNERDGKLLEALDQVGRRVALAGNKDPIGFAWVTHNPLTFLTALFDRSPAVKSMVARGMYANAERAARVAPGTIRVALTALTSTGGSEDAPALENTAK